jgi:polyphosphate kinase
VKGLSENIEVLSVIGRFLEHSRVFYFANGSDNPLDGDYFIGSADWMHRNLHNRVELITPILDVKLKERLWEFLDIILNDNRQVWTLQENGTYLQRIPLEGEVERGTHSILMQKTIQREKALS